MKKHLTFLFTIIMLTSLLTGCNNGSEPEAGTGGETNQYEYVFRDLPEANYIEVADKFAAGAGTKEDPYQIATAEELALLAELVNDTEAEKSYRKAYYILTADISLNDTSNVNDWAKSAPEYSWNPIGASEEFEGVFDGNGHIISGMYINTNYDDANDYSQGEYGLFGNVSGTVKNVVLEQSYICVSGYSAYVGGIVGSLRSSGVIDNCTSAVTMECYDGTYGGIAGHISGHYISVNDGSDNVKPEFAIVDNCKFEGVIRQIKDESFSRLGGIVGGGEGQISECINVGAIYFTGDNIDVAGGIIAYISAGAITDCENKGSLNCEIVKEKGFAYSGGIAGGASLSNIGGVDYRSRGVIIQGCQNTGLVSGQAQTGGIVGKATNDNNDYCITIKDCTNSSSEVKSPGNTGGIVGYLSCKAANDNDDNIRIENCENTGALAEGLVGGIVGQFLCEEGDVTLSNCKNSGNLTTINQNCAGIIAYWQTNGAGDFNVKIFECENTGTITSSYNAGGILCYVNGIAIGDALIETSQIIIDNCTNSGNIITNGLNGYIGGICGNLGIAYVPTSVSNCTNTGELSVLTDTPDKETIDAESTFTLSRIAGGIVGRVGYGIILSTDTDKGMADNIQKEDAVIRFVDCYNYGMIDATAENEVYMDYFGGIIGNCSGEEAYSIFVKDCGYTNFERGLGNPDYPDVGSRISE